MIQILPNISTAEMGRHNLHQDNNIRPREDAHRNNNSKLVEDPIDGIVSVFIDWGLPLNEII
jgi:hypothetical protein